MRILHVHSGNLYGGVETMLRSLARCCAARTPRNRPVFALSYEGRIARELRLTGCEVHPIGGARAVRPWSVMQARGKVAALCGQQAFAATVVHSAWALALLGPGGQRPLILFQHDVPGGPAWTRIWSRRNRPDLVIANSRFVEAHVAPAYPGVPVTTVHPAVDLPPGCIDEASRTRIRQAFRTPRTSKVILIAARFEPWKGHRLLLDALATLRHLPDWILWIAGHPQRPAEVTLKVDLQAAAQRYGISARIVFLGHIEDMAALMRAADIYCQPNTGPEPFGITFVEALHAGLAVIATALGGATEILNADCGLFVEPAASSIAAALQRCFDDAALRQWLAETGPTRARMLCHPPTQLQAIENAILALGSSRAAA